MSTIASTRTTERVIVDRRQLLGVLDRMRAVALNRRPKPILTGVRLAASDGVLRFAATDGEIRLSTRLEAEGGLSPCVVSCAELMRRVRVSKDDICTLALRGPSARLVFNGGRVEHMLPIMPEEEFPLIPDRQGGAALTVAAEELRSSLNVVSRFVARETSRYAIDGILLESDQAGTRLVATDGRRLIVHLVNATDCGFTGQVILPGRLVRLISKLTGRSTGPIVIAIQRQLAEDGTERPGELYAAAAGWLASTPEPEGRFPLYRDVIPPSQSKFVVDRQRFNETLEEVAMAASAESQAVHIVLTPRRIRLSAQSSEGGESSAGLQAHFIGGGDSEIHTAFNPAYLLDALKSLDGDEVVIDVGQNTCGNDGKVFCRPALLYTRDSDATRCVIMPINADLPPTRENLGSNYRSAA